MKQSEIEKELARQIESIVNGPGSKSDKARELFRIGCERTDAVELLGITYGQAHTCWKQVKEDWQPQVRGGSGPGSGGRFAKAVEAEARRQLNLQFSPAQVRYLTQDGHRIKKVDKDGETVCNQCGATLAFSLMWLGFVHAYSKAEPTQIEEKYPEWTEPKVLRQKATA